jgi:membrane protein implicated in regulation of membrane protease activity
MISDVLAFSLEDWGAMEKIFLICALVGGSLFVIRLVLMFFGGDTDFDGDVGDVDIDVDADMDVDSDIDGAGPDISFKLLSFQGFTAFFMMFGLVGIAMMRQSGQKEIQSLLVASLAGFGTAWIMKFIFSKAKTLQSSGNIRMQNAVGAEGDVYLNIPAEGIGKARVRVQNHLKIWDARTEDGQEIKTGERVRVNRVVDGNILMVQKIENGQSQKES